MVMTVVRVLIAMVLSLLWDRFINTDGLRSLDYATSALGLILLAFSWFSYLSQDGIEGLGKLFDFFRNRKAKKKGTMRSRGGDISDYVDDEVVSYDDLDDEDRKTCRFLANLLAGLIMLFITLVIVIVS